jgi:hypothetical protein
VRPVASVKSADILVTIMCWVGTASRAAATHRSNRHPAGYLAPYSGPEETRFRPTDQQQSAARAGPWDVPIPQHQVPSPTNRRPDPGLRREQPGHALTDGPKEPPVQSKINRPMRTRHGRSPAPSGIRDAPGRSRTLSTRPGPARTQPRSNGRATYEPPRVHSGHRNGSGPEQNPRSEP